MFIFPLILLPKDDHVHLRYCCLASLSHTDILVVKAPKASRSEPAITIAVCSSVLQKTLVYLRLPRVVNGWGATGISRDSWHFISSTDG